MKDKYKAHAVKIEAKQNGPRIIQLALWICNERISPLMGSPFEPKSFNSVEDATAYAQAAARQIIDKRIKEFASTVGISPAALDEILECIEQKTAYRSAADLLRKEYNTPLSTELWSRIRKWVDDSDTSLRR